VKLTPRYAAELAARWGARWRRRADRPHGLVLMYHRVADAAIDPWGLCVSPANFREQMRVLAEMAEPVPLDRLTETLRSGRSAKPVVAVTFDDGYLDNLTAAKPVLDEFDIPATVFIATGLTGTTRPLWWDRLANAVLGTGRMPAKFELRAAGFEFSWQDSRLPDPGARASARGNACIGRCGPGSAICLTRRASASSRRSTRCQAPTPARTRACGR
jgi:peptidoglycan/xylan/chitin deacetylase (PgdA/CDA1 family)